MADFRSSLFGQSGPSAAPGLSVGEQAHADTRLATKTLGEVLIVEIRRDQRRFYHSDLSLG